MKEKVEEVWKKYNNYKEVAEQHQFVQLLFYDRILIPLYEDLQINWNEDHAKKFIDSINNIVFKNLGI